MRFALSPRPWKRRPAARRRGLAVLVFGLLSSTCAPPSTAPRPHVVIVLIDTLRADALGTYGDTRGASPHMDALAEEGIVFDQASAAAPWTLPSVVSMFSSRFIAEHNVTRDGQKVADSLPNLAVGLSDAGYTTASFVKNPYAGEYSGLDRGFDVVEYRRGKGQTTGRRIEEWLKQAPPGPLFMYVHNSQPHDPLLLRRRDFLEHFGEVSPEDEAEILKTTKTYRTLTRVDFVRKRPLGTVDNTEQQKRAMAKLAEKEEVIERAYAGSVYDADDRVGEIVQALKDGGVWDNTLFLVVADHGEEMNDHGGWQHDQSVYEELIRVPFLLRLPKGELAGTRVSTPVSLVDVLPTVFDYLDLEVEGSVRGASVLPLARRAAEAGEPAGDDAEMRVVAMRHNVKKYFKPYKRRRGDLNLVVRKGRWKAILNLEPDTVELYDLQTDPRETRELSTKRPELALEMQAFGKAELEAFLANAVRPAGDEEDTGDAETLEALKMLGYVGDDEEQ